MLAVDLAPEKIPDAGQRADDPIVIIIIIGTTDTPPVVDTVNGGLLAAKEAPVVIRSPGEEVATAETTTGRRAHDTPRLDMDRDTTAVTEVLTVVIGTDRVKITGAARAAPGAMILLLPGTKTAPPVEMTCSGGTMLLAQLLLRNKLRLSERT